MKDEAALRSALLRHYDQHARELPWRNNPSPYAVWVSEVMLQQTRVATVVPYFERWMAHFPSVEALAGADLEEVLECWSGLGYYSRARNLHRGAKVVRECFRGAVPGTLDQLRSIPGIGEYTAGAVASIAFGLGVPAVDGNVRRVLARLYDLEVTTPSVLRTVAAELQEPTRPGDFNQALMELGATICTPRRPQCETCPVAVFCRSRANGTVHERPAKRHRARRSEVTYRSFVALNDQGQALLVRRPDEGLLAGMWEFPSLECDGSAGPDVKLGLKLAPVRHEFTHLLATYYPFVLEGVAGAEELERVVPGLDLSGRATRLHRLDALDALAVSRGQLKIALAVLLRSLDSKGEV